MDNDIKLSIIIPVYNVEKYLQACLDSITCQYNDSCEIILIDDGSTDSSGVICDKNENERIKIIHKANGGLSSARNEGLRHARGKYVAFVDADDLIEDGSIKAILQWINNSDADICFMQAIKFYPDGKEEPLGDNITSNDVDGKSADKVMSFLASRKKYPGSACTKLYKRTFLEDNRICFPNDKRVAEDLGFIMDCLLKADSFSAIDFPYYKYRQNREGSRTNTVSVKSVDGLLTFIKESVEKLTVNYLPKDEKCSYAMSFVAYEYMVLLHNYAGLSINDRRLKRAAVSQFKWVLKYGTTAKAKIVGLLMYLLGAECTARTLRWLYNKRLETK